MSRLRNGLEQFFYLGNPDTEQMTDTELRERLCSVGRRCVAEVAGGVAVTSVGLGLLLTSERAMNGEIPTQSIVGLSMIGAVILYGVAIGPQACGELSHLEEELRNRLYGPTDEPNIELEQLGINFGLLSDVNPALQDTMAA